MNCATTVNADHRALFAAARAAGAADGEMMLAQIRAAVAVEDILQRSTPMSERVKKQEVDGQILETPRRFAAFNDFAVAGSLVRAGRPDDRRAQTIDVALVSALVPAEAGGCDPFFHNREPSVTKKANERSVSACESQNVFSDADEALGRVHASSAA